MAKLDLPRYLKWRDGRPRWELGGRGGVELRKAGFASVDLKNQHGAWLGLEDAMARAAQLNAAVDAWRRGEDPADIAAASSGALDGSGKVRSGFPPGAIGQQKKTIADLIDAFEASTDFRANKPATRATYRVHGVTLRRWIGDVAPRAIDRKTARHLFENLLDVGFYAAEQRAKGVRRAYGWHQLVLDLSAPQRTALRERRLTAMEDDDFDGKLPGYAAAYCIAEYARNVFQRALDNGLIDGGTDANPFSRMRKTAPAGRIREILDDELACLDATAQEMGRPEAGDAWVLGVQCAQRRADLAGLTWSVRETRRVHLVQQKTGKEVNFRASALMMKRLDEIWERRKLANRPRVDRILINANGDTFDGNRAANLTKLCREVRTEAARKLPSCADILLHDARDTAVTRLFRAGLDLLRVCEVSGHSLKQAETIRKGYFAANAEVADQATDALDAWNERMGHKL